MMPSPAGTTPDEFRVYRARSFPGDWELAESTLSGELRIDPTQFRYDGTWYLLYQQAGSFDVRLRWANSLVDGTWRDHPASPLFEPGGNDIACGGRPVIHEDCVDVFFRRGTPGIVESWRLFDLSPESLSAVELPGSPLVSGTDDGGWNGLNMHYIDAGELDAEGIVVVDGQDQAGDYRIGVYRDE